ncbi:MAG: RICIN domain-containing protein [Clostridia bacterium]|nr:RICIN domain-containing protein [Clostridia bacterium]
MKKVLAVLVCLCMILGAMPAFAYEEAPFRLKIDLDDKSPFGEFEGWGTSICWWGHHLGDDLSAEDLDTAVKALYDYDEGLGLNIVRYNIGGGDDPEHDHMGSWDGRDMPGVLASDGTWDFTKDRGQIDALVLSVKYGADIVEAFSNSPPYFMTASGCSSGNYDANEDNLPKENYDEFADFLVEVVLYLQNTYGIEIDTLEPMNEPSTNYWSYEGWQEGCHIDAENHSDLIMACRAALDAAGLDDVGVAAADETSISTTANNIANIYTDEAIETLAQINTHSYTVGSYEALREAALAVGKKLYITEVDGNGVLGEEAGNMGPALWFSQKITDDLRGLEANAWVMWQALAMDYTSSSSDEGYWNICQFNRETHSVNKLKKYYAYMQYTKFIRPGDTLVKANSDNVLAAVNEEDGKLVFVITNSEGKDKEFDIVTENIGMNVESVKAYATTKTTDCEEVSIASLNSVTVPANSIMTVVIEGEINGSSISLAEVTGAECAFSGEELEFVVTDENGNEVEAEITIDDAAIASVEGKKVTVTGEGEFTVTATYGTLRDSVTIYALTDSSLARIVGRGSGKALNGKNTSITIAEVSDEASQMWQLERDGEYLLFKNVRSGKYLSAENGLTIGEKNDYAYWKVEKDEGYYSLINKETGQSADVYNHATSAGAGAGMYDYNGGANQQWYFIAESAVGKDAELDCVCEAQKVTGEPFGTNSWIGNEEVSFDKAWDGDSATFFDAESGTGGYTGVDLGEEHLSVNKVELYPRSGFDYRITGGMLMGCDEKDGEYVLLHTFDAGEIENGRATVYLDEAVNYRYIKYVSPEEGYCNAGEIILYHDLYKPEAGYGNGKYYLSLGETAPAGGESYVVSYFEEGILKETRVVTKDELEDAINAENGAQAAVYAEDGSLILKVYFN